MGLLDTARAIGRGLIAVGRAVAGDWSWRGGATASRTLWDGSKFKGSLIYPSAWDIDNATLRARSRIAYWDSPHGRAMLTRLVDNVVGTGLSLESSPVWSLIGGGGTEEERHAKARDIELRFHLWAASHEPDAADFRSLYELQAAAFLNLLRDGESISVLRYSGDPGRMNPLSIQTIDPDQVGTPLEKIHEEAATARGNRIIDGVEVDKALREIALFVAGDDPRSVTRVPVMGGSGRRFVVHARITDTIGQVRGTPILAPLVHELQKLTDYTVAEIEAAVINAVLAVWIEPSADAPASRALGGIALKNTGGTTTAETRSAPPRDAAFTKPGVIIQNLKAGEKVQSFDTKRPNVNFAAFTDAVAGMASASLGIPLEVLKESFNANYSASRASLILFWNVVEKWRDIMGSQFLNLVFEAWLAEEVKAGRIPAPGFVGASPVIRRAWLNCSWLGASKPSIDPLKEANAARARIEDGATTREREALAYNGSDFAENAARLTIENVALAAANAPMKPAPAPAQAAPDDTEDETPDVGEGEEE